KANCTGQRIGHERRAVHQRAGLVRADRVRDVAAAQRRGQRDVAAGERLANTHDVGADARVVGGEQLPGAAEPGGNLVEDQQDVVAVADRTQVNEIPRVVEPHAPRALHDGFDDHGGQLVGVFGQLLFEHLAVGGVVFTGYLGRELLAGQDVGPQRVHPALWVAHAHRGEGVAVVAAAPGHQPVLVASADAAPVLQRHLDGHLDRYRAGVAEEHRIESVGRDLYQ